MAYLETKIPHGIHTVTVGTVAVTTVNLRLKDTFPTWKLPKEVLATSQCSGKSGKYYTQLLYTAVSSRESQKVVKKLGALLRQHAQNQLYEKYAWVDKL